MVWNYRLVEEEELGQTTYTLCEVFFNSKMEPFGYTPATLIVDRKEDAEDVFRMMETALYKPIIRPGDLVEDME